MRCEEVQDVLLGNEGIQAELQAHVADCPRCGELCAALGSLRAPAPSPGFHARVLAALEREPTPVHRVDPTRWLVRAAAAIAVISYGSLALWVTSLRLHVGQSPPPVFRTEGASDARQRAWMRERFGWRVDRYAEGGIQ